MGYRTAEDIQAGGIGVRQPLACEITDKMIDAANRHRDKLGKPHDEPVHAEVSPKLYRDMIAWGAVDYLDIAWNIHVKPKEQ